MIVIGTRPEIVKMAPVIRVFEDKGISFVLVHCGQHYDYNMSQTFIEELELPTPEYGFKVKETSPGAQTGRILSLIEGVAEKVDPKVVLVEGDTNGVFAAALAVVKLGISVGHIEAGLRSFDYRMPEEYNRRLVDHISSFLFAPTYTAEQNLERESVWGKVFVTGNTVIDAVLQHLPLAQRRSSILEEIRFERFALATAHRAENVDNPQVLRNLVEAFAEAPIPIVYPVHPRTKKRLRQWKMWKGLLLKKNVQVLEPVGYFDFLLLMKECEMVITDSGGLQEEATSPNIRKPVIVVRLSTERPEAVQAGFATVVGVEKKAILAAVEQTLKQKHKLPLVSPYGDGAASDRIVKALIREMSG
ncbi:MAG: UDP-N-acetylglucosamine 2-epimerase (non-hydrolyzing) [Candidatus Bathyarchaeota archaeon]|nr:MAG: UDP-N-acetylglucosamine 2-epimerase (non-hydrolyzing) [Candidatus Bathyarchaeota archaeon]